jgi:hypothetical protein
MQRKKGLFSERYQLRSSSSRTDLLGHVGAMEEHDGFESRVKGRSVIAGRGRDRVGYLDPAGEGVEGRVNVARPGCRRKKKGIGCAYLWSLVKIPSLAWVALISAKGMVGRSWDVGRTLESKEEDRFVEERKERELVSRRREASGWSSRGSMHPHASMGIERPVRARSKGQHRVKGGSMRRDESGVR